MSGWERNEMGLARIRSVAILLALSAVLGAPGENARGETGALPAPAGPQTVSLRREGRVKSVDHRATAFIVASEGMAPCQFAWNARTSFLVAGHPVKANTLAPGRDVQVEYRIDGNRFLALRVTIYPVRANRPPKS